MKKSLSRNLGIAAILLLSITAPAGAAPVKNIVLVHGAWVDASGWKPVYQILSKDGYHVTMVQEPLTSLQDDVAATKRILDQQSGPTILVGHSYGGSVITAAASPTPAVPRPAGQGPPHPRAGRLPAG